MNSPPILDFSGWIESDIHWGPEPVWLLKSPWKPILFGRMETRNPAEADGQLPSLWDFVGDGRSSPEEPPQAVLAPASREPGVQPAAAQMFGVARNETAETSRRFLV